MKRIIFLIMAMSLSALFISAASVNEDAMSDFIDSTQQDSAAMADPVKDRFRLLIRKGDEFFQAKNYKEAAKYYFASTKVDPGNKDGWKKTAFSLYQQKNHKLAVGFFKKVLAIDPEDKDALEFMEFYGNVIENKNKKKEKREMFDSVWRASVAPGWGQIHNNQMLKGIIVSSAFSVSLGLTIYNVIDQHAKYDLYLKTNENHEIAYKKAQEASTTVLVFSLITATVYGLQITDAALNYDCDEARMTVDVRPIGGGAAVFAKAGW